MDTARSAFVVRLNGRPSKHIDCLLTIGREEKSSDILLDPLLMSELQCQIFFNKSTLEVILRDKSVYDSTYIYSANSPQPPAVAFGQQRPRQTVLLREDKVEIGTGDPARDPYLFEIIWPAPSEVNFEAVKLLKEDFIARPRLPNEATTNAGPPTDGFQFSSSLQTPLGTVKWLHRTQGYIGWGAFGEVKKTINLRTGNYHAVKILQPQEGWDKVVWKRAVAREVSYIKDNRHVSSCFACNPESHLSFLWVKLRMS